jgi:hypothetical protein
MPSLIEATRASRWTYTAVVTLFHEAGARLAVRPPPGSELRGLSIDGNLVPLGPAGGNGTVTLPVPLTGGVRQIIVDWSGADVEAFEHPDPVPPTFEADGRPIPAGPSLFTLAVVPGWRVSHNPSPESADIPVSTATEGASTSTSTTPRSLPGDRNGPVTLSVADGYRAEAEVRLATLLTDRGVADREPFIMAGAARFATLATRAERRAADAYRAGSPPGTGPDKVGLVEWLGQLRERLATLKAKPTKPGPVRTPELGPIGTPACWAAAPGVVPLIELTPIDVIDRTVWLRSLLAVVLALALAVAAGCGCWPEQLALAGGLAVAIGGPIALFGWTLAGLGVAARAARLVARRPRSVSA